MDRAEFRKVAHQARLGQHLVPPGPAQQQAPRATQIPAWLVDWAALQAEYQRRDQYDNRSTGNLLYPALKLAPANEEGAWLLNCTAYARTVYATSIEDLQFAIRGFQAALSRTRDPVQAAKIRLNMGWAYTVLGAPHIGARLCCALYTQLPPDSPFQVGVRMTLAMAWTYGGEHEEAYRCLVSALPLATAGTSRHNVIVANLAGLALFLGRRADAQQWLAALPANHGIGAAWMHTAFVALQDGDRHQAAAHVEYACSLISVAQVNWRERHVLALGYRILAAMATGTSRHAYLRVAAHFAGVTDGPRWLKDLSATIATDEPGHTQTESA